MKNKMKEKSKIRIKKNVFAFSLTHVAWNCHSIFVCKVCIWPSGAIDDQLSFDWPGSAIPLLICLLVSFVFLKSRTPLGKRLLATFLASA